MLQAGEYTHHPQNILKRFVLSRLPSGPNLQATPDPLSVEPGCFCSKLHVTHIYTICPLELVSSTQNNDFCNIYLFLFGVVWGVLPPCVSVSRKVERW